jgi:hypothetical protein
MDETETIEDVVCLRETAKAILVEIDGDEGDLVVAQWFAEREGLI